VVIDTSALIALLLAEPEADRLRAALESDPVRRVSAATVVEASMVMLRRFGDAGDASLGRLLRALNADVIAVDLAQTSVTRDSALRYRRGPHPAALNFGDCFSYALASVSGEALLSVGDDFAQTDVSAVPW
jgi:ribonuclease VapC